MMARRSNAGFFQRLLETGSRTTYQGKIRTRGGHRAGTVRQGKQTVYKGVRIIPVGEGEFETSLDPSRFDSLRDAKRFVDAWKKQGNPAKRYIARQDVGGEYLIVDRATNDVIRTARTKSAAIQILASLNAKASPGWQLKRNPRGTKGRFERCVKAVSERGGAIDPRAVCGAQERKYRGNRPRRIEMTRELARAAGQDAANRKMRKGGRTSWSRADYNEAVRVFSRLWPESKPNPADSAVEAYKIFHGREPEELVTIAKQRHYHKHLAAAGELEKLVIENDRYRVTLQKFKGALLAFNEQALPELARKGKVKLTQLFIEGGDQSVNLEDFGIDLENVHEIETLGKAVKIDYFTTKDHLGSEGGTATYGHKFRSTNKDGKHVTVKIAKYPDVIYRVRDNQLEFSGGSYEIRAEGIDK